MAKEFMLDGKRAAIKCAKPNNHQCGPANGMRDRADCIICASLTVGCTFNVYRIIPEQWKQHAHELSKRNRNHGHGCLTLLSRSAYRRIEEDQGEVETED